ncbi:putative transposase of IS4/5 family DUF4096 [Couchioplanes caeruleus]|uniref:Putative transposase of IS4/5 family DUF4096 n=1 Tax=Couchioplanes caeruleus TaxID=56438 RepID=A0A3N1GHF2_9ACTN|nr:putative transposase of IS4/5 family DUF4096 [Couchioplanes caeruleus]
MATLAVTRRFDLTDVQWALLAALLPAPKRSDRPSRWTKRQLIDGIRWRVRTGAPWRDVPDCYGSWQAVYALFRRWQRAGLWAQIVTGLQARADTVGLITWDVSVDSTIARAHQHAAGARISGQREPAGGVGPEPSDHALGRSRGGWTTKLHLACEQGGKPLSMLLGAGSRHASRARPTRTPTAWPKAPGAAVHPPSTRRSTGNATPWSAASTASNATAPSPLASTNLAARYEATLHITAINEWLHALRDAPSPPASVR